MNALLEKVQPPPAVSIADLVREIEKSGERIAKLESGEPCFPTPQYIKEIVFNALEQNHTHYSASQGILELRKALSDWYYEDFNFSVSPEEILIGHGGIGVIHSLINTLINNGDEVIVIDPCWPQYVNIAILAGASVKRISTKNSNGKLTIDVLKANLSNKTKLVIINNPSNPSGVIYNEDEINAIIDAIRVFGSYILFDEVYNRIIYDSNFKSALQCKFYNTYREKIIYLNSFSKTFAMTGWRLGYAFMDGHLMSKVLRVSQNTITHANTFCQYAAAVAVSEKKKHQHEFDEMFKLYKQRNSELTQILEIKGLTFMRPGGAFYFFIKIKKNSVGFAKLLLEKYKIAVVPGIAYGKDFDDHFRISFAVDQYSYDACVHWLKNFKFDPWQ